MPLTTQSLRIGLAVTVAVPALALLSSCGGAAATPGENISLSAPLPTKVPKAPNSWSGTRPLKSR